MAIDGWIPDKTIKGSVIAMDVRIRNARPDDIEALLALLDELFSIDKDLTADPESRRRALNMMLGGCRKHHCIKVAQSDGQVVGMCTVQILVSTAEGGMVGFVENMVVNARFRNQGIGRLLMTHIEDWAGRHGLMRLQLLVDRTNFSALDIYDKIGWCPTRQIFLRSRWKQQY